MKTQSEKNLNVMREARSSRMLPGMAGWAACCKHQGFLWSNYSGKRWAVAELRHSEASSPEHYHHKIVICWGCKHTFIWFYRHMQRQAGQALPEESVRLFLDRNSFCRQVVKDYAILMVTIECMWASLCKRYPRINFPFHAYYGFPRKSKFSLKNLGSQNLTIFRVTTQHLIACKAGSQYEVFRASCEFVIQNSYINHLPCYSTTKYHFMPLKFIQDFLNAKLSSIISHQYSVIFFPIFL